MSNEKQIARRYASGRFCLFNYDLLYIGDLQIAVLLSLLINEKDKLERNGTEIEWFTCSEKYIQNKIRMSRRVQSKWLNWLRTQGYIKTIMKGIPAKRYLSLNMGKIDRDVTNEIEKERLSQVRTIVPVRESTVVLSLGENGHSHLIDTDNKRYKNSVEPDVSTERRDEYLNGTIRGVNMPFIDRQDTKLKTIHISMAKELRKILVNNHRRRKWSQKKWANEFRLLELKDKVPLSTIQSVLDWYGENIRKITFPKYIFNASQFREYFFDIQDQMKIDTMVISNNAKEIAGLLIMKYRWKGTEDKLPIAVQVTLDSFTSFNKRLRTVVGLNHLLTKRGTDWRAYQLTKQWFIGVQERIINWTKWNKDIVAMAWDGDLHNKQFTNLGLDYVPNRKNWDKIIKELE